MHMSSSESPLALRPVLKAVQFLAILATVDAFGALPQPTLSSETSAAKQCSADAEPASSLSCCGELNDTSPEVPHCDSSIPEGILSMLSFRYAFSAVVAVVCAVILASYSSYNTTAVVEVGTGNCQYCARCINPPCKCIANGACQSGTRCIDNPLITVMRPDRVVANVKTSPGQCRLPRCASVHPLY